MLLKRVQLRLIFVSGNSPITIEIFILKICLSEMKLPPCGYNYPLLSKSMIDNLSMLFSFSGFITTVITELISTRAYRFCFVNIQ